MHRNRVTDIVICGLVRDQARLLHKIDDYVSWRNEGKVGKIIFSTWIDEVEKYSGLRDALRGRNVFLMEIREPKLVLKGGHQLHQMAAFHYGLSVIEDDETFVLKTRVDLADNNAHMPHFFLEGTEVSRDFACVGISHKILIENTQMMYPFLSGDAQFFGKKGDLKKLVNMSNEMEMIFNRLAVEQSFFFEPFVKSKLFREHFYWNLPHISEIAHKREEQIEYASKTETIMDVLKAWWLVLDSYFIVGWNNSDIEDQEFPSSLAECFSYDLYDKFIGADKSDVIASSVFVKHLVSLIGSREIERISALCADTGHSNPFAIETEKFKAYEKFRNLFSDLPSAKATHANATTYTIDGAAQHFFVKDSNDKASTRYHEQVTALRRENDMLKKELNIRFSHSRMHRLLNQVLPRKTIDFMKYKLPFVTNMYARYFMSKKV